MHTRNAEGATSAQETETQAEDAEGLPRPGLDCGVAGPSYSRLGGRGPYRAVTLCPAPPRRHLLSGLPGGAARGVLQPPAGRRATAPTRGLAGRDGAGLAEDFARSPAGQKPQG